MAGGRAQIVVEILGDSSSLEKAFKSSAQGATEFNSQMQGAAKTTESSFVRIRAARGKSLGLIRLAGVGLGAGVAIAAATRAVGALADKLKVSGDAAGTFQGQMRNMGAALLSGDVVGAVHALTVQTHAFTQAQLEAAAASPKLIEQLKNIGFAGALAKAQLAEVTAVAQTPLILQLRAARAADTPGRADDISNLRAQIAQKTRAIGIEQKLRVRGMDENQVVAALIQLTNDRKALRDRLNAAIDADNKAKAEAAKKEREAAEKPFLEAIQGLGLKAEKAKLTKSLDDDIAASELIIKRIERQIKIEGDTFKLESQLVDAQLTHQDLLDQKQTAAAAAAQAAAEKRQQEAERRRKAAEAARKRQQQAIENARKAAQARAARIKGDEFEALGLTRAGEQRAPGRAALRRRVASLREQVAGTTLDTPKTTRELDRISNVLSSKFKTVGRDVRLAILQMLDDISGALKGKTGQGPLTKTTALDTKALARGLGLSPEQERALEARASRFTSAGRAIGGTRTTGGGFVGAERPVYVQSNVTVELDGQKIATVVTRRQQAGRRRNPQQKRGPNRRGA